jgi:large subunit ribosomal protein L18
MILHKEKIKRQKRQLRHNRVRSQISGTSERPRLAVFRSSSHIYAQIIDDTAGKTLAAASSADVKSKGKKADLSTEVGTAIAEKAKAKKISKVVFDRGGYQYHGRVKALAEAARAAGLEF